MRVDAGVDRVLSMRTRLGIKTPCAECADPSRDTYCDTCIAAVACVVGESFARAKATYGRKRWHTPRT